MSHEWMRQREDMNASQAQDLNIKVGNLLKWLQRFHLTKREINKTISSDWIWPNRMYVQCTHGMLGFAFEFEDAE